jgi:hypothetical protein
MVWHCVSLRSSIKANTYIDYGFDLAEDRSDRFTNEWNSLKQASFANENVQKHLVNPNELIWMY